MIISGVGGGRTLVVGHTAFLDADLREGAHGLLREVFDDLTPEDWDHALGGVNALVHEPAEPDGRRPVVAHAAVVQRVVAVDDRPLRCGYVEAVAVRADRRGLGLGDAVMAPLEDAITRAYDLGALGSTDEALTFYARRGWIAWPGPTAGLTPSGVTPTPDEDGAVFVWPAAVAAGRERSVLVCDWRSGDLW